MLTKKQIDYNEYNALPDELINLERKRKMILIKAFIGAVLKSTILAIVFFIAGYLVMQYGKEIVDWLDLILSNTIKKILIILIILVIYVLPLDHFFYAYLKKQYAFKNEFLKALIPIYNKGLNVIDEREISDNEKDEFNIGNIFSKYHDHYHTNTYSEGKINNLKIKVADLYIYEVSTQGKGHRITDFDGILEIIELPINYNGFAILEKKEMFRQNKYVKFEKEIDKELAKNFNFYTDNINDANTFFSKDIIRMINEFYNTYKIPLYITIKDNKLYIGFDNRRNFTKKSCLSKINTKNINTVIYDFNQLWDFTEDFINIIMRD